LLGTASRPVIVAGGGVTASDAREELEILQSLAPPDPVEMEGRG